MTDLYADIAGPLVITLLVCAIVGRATSAITARTAAGLEVLAAAGGAIYTYLDQDWPWDAISILITLILIGHWATYPTKRERREQENQR